MPSHSSSGGSGASFGGGGGHGGFSGSSSRGFSEGPGMRPRPPRPPLFHSPWRFHFFGRPVVVTTGGQMGFAAEIFLFIIALVVLIFSIGTYTNSGNYLKSVNSRISLLTTQQEQYNAMIEKAKSDEENYGIVTAEFDKKAYSTYSYEENDRLTGLFRYETEYSAVPRYFLRYKFVIDGKEIYGETYAVYTTSSFSGGGELSTGTIQVAYHKIQAGETPIDNGDASYAKIYGYDSINLDFTEVGFELEEAKEYLLQEATNSRGSSKTMLTVVGIINGVIVLAIIITIVVTIVKCREEKVEALEEKQKSEAEAAELKKKKYCTFCGTVVPDDETKCPNCGASKFERK